MMTGGMILCTVLPNLLWFVRFCHPVSFTRPESFSRTGERKKGPMVQSCFSGQFPGTHCFHTGPHCFTKREYVFAAWKPAMAGVAQL